MRKKIENYLSACDAMLHARWEGETFGLSCAEFLIRGKPIITWSSSRERNHFLLAEDSIITYNFESDLAALLTNMSIDFIKYKASLIDKAYLINNYSQENVSIQFKEILAKLV